MTIIGGVVFTHYQTAVLRFEDVRTCTCHRIYIPLVENIGRRPKRNLGRTWIEEPRLKSWRTMILSVRWMEIVAVRNKDSCSWTCCSGR